MRFTEIRDSVFPMLMNTLMHYLNKGFSSRISFSIYDVSTQGIIETEERQLSKNQKISPQDLALIAYRFAVSYQAVVYRLHSLRYLSQKAREELLEEEHKGKKYLRLLDLEDLEQPNKQSLFQRELKTYISRLVIEAYRQQKISRGRVIELCKLLNLPPQDIIELVNIENE
jgi:hypothetical protein